MFVNGIEWAILRVAGADADISREASHPLSPASAPLRRGKVIVGGTFENVFGSGNVIPQPREFITDQKINIGIVSTGRPIQPSFDPPLPIPWIARRAPGPATVQRNNDSIVVISKVHLPGHHQLLGIVQTLNTLRLGFGLAQRG